MTSSLIRHQLNDAVSGHSRLKEQYAELQREYVECFRRLAKILLEAASKHIPSHEVQLDLAKRAQRRSDLIVNAGKLDAELKEKLDALVSMENRLAYLQKERDKRLLGEPFAVMQKNIEQERSRYEKKHAVLSSVNNDLKELVMSYEANEYYQYLKAKKFVPAEGLSRFNLQGLLDSWLASKIKFAENLNNERIIEHFLAVNEAKMSDAAKCLEETELLFYNALVRLEEEIGLTSAIAVNEGLSGEIGEIESLIAKARGDLWELDGNMDHEFKQLHDKVHKLLAAANSNDLRVLVHSTPTPEDDLVLDRIKSLESSIAMLDGHMACAAQNVENLRELYNYACAEESRQAAIVGAVNSRSPSFSFRSSSSYNFSSCGGTGHSSSFGSGSSSSSSCGGGSYRSSSSFGGGGFKTTGSF